MSDSVVKQIAGLHRLSASELKDRWRELYGTEPPGYNRTSLIKRLPYRAHWLGPSGRWLGPLRPLASPSGAAG